MVFQRNLCGVFSLLIRVSSFELGGCALLVQALVVYVSVQFFA